ncbi:MAG: type II toxin-antitoxin system HicB family antitoxin [Candidatus Rokubacteria bacterium]|nr:type II toxin-antitoxin system HicB family antitoxin [Candidatus Rokubacteria bacterium]
MHGVRNEQGRGASAAARTRPVARQLSAGVARGRGAVVVRYDADVKFYSFEIVIEKEEDDEGYLAYSPTLPGCFSNGKTIEEARKNVREAIQQHVSSLLAHGQPVPQND